MKITRNVNGAISVDGKKIDTYLFIVFLIAKRLGPPSKATPAIIKNFLKWQKGGGDETV